MSWNTKYRTEIKDINGIDFKIDIEEDAFAGSITNLTSTGDPIQFDFDNESDDVVEPLKPSSVSFSIFSTSNFALIDLYSTEDMQFRVKAYQSGTLYWMGYIITRYYEEIYEDYPYPVTVKACCGLELLKDISYDDSGTPYEGWMLESQIILDILGKIGHTGFTEYINIYEESMSTGIGNSPMDQLMINTDVFADMYCDEVLKEILKKYNACIINKSGTFSIYRPIELTQATVYGRIFTTATSKSPTSITPAQYINRTAHSTTREQSPGGILMIQSPAKKIIIKQNYGNKESIIKNFKFSGDTFDGTDFDEWTQTADTNAKPISRSHLPNEGNDGVYLDSYDDSSPYGYYIYQSFGDRLVSTDDTGIIEFDYLLDNRSGSSVDNVYTMVQLTQGSYYLSNAGAWVVSTQAISITNTAISGSSGWQHHKLEIINGLKVDGPITIKLFASNKSDVRIAYKNIKFYFYSTTIIRKGVTLAGRERMSNYSSRYNKYMTKIFRTLSLITEKEYLPSCTPTNGIELIYEYILGDVVGSDIDNVLEQFAGALATVALDTLTQTAADFVMDHGSDYPGIVVDHSSNTITFTEDDGNDFTGNTTITNTAGDLSGSVENTQAHVVGQPEIDNIELTGTNGSAEITCNGHAETAVFNGSLAQTAIDFKDNYEADYLTIGVIVTTNGVNIIFTEEKSEGGFTGNTTIINKTGDLSGNKTDTQNPIVHVNRIDSITLSGGYGTANILCDSVTKDIDVDEVLTAASDWNTRSPGSESKPLLEIIGDEIAKQYSRPKQLIQMPVIDRGSAVSAINTIGNFQDDLNQLSGSNRKFVSNRSRFDVKNRKWEIDLMEIIE